MDDIRLVNEIENPMYQDASDLPQFTLNGAATLRIEGTVDAVSSAIGSLLLLAHPSHLGADLILVNFTDKFWSTEDHGPEGTASASISFSVSAPPSPGDAYLLASARVLFFNATASLDAAGATVDLAGVLTAVDPSGLMPSLSVDFALPPNATSSAAAPISGALEDVQASLDALNITLWDTSCVFGVDFAIGAKFVTLFFVPESDPAPLFCDWYMNGTAPALNATLAETNAWATSEEVSAILLGSLDVNVTYNPLNNSVFEAAVFASYGSVFLNSACGNAEALNENWLYSHPELIPLGYSGAVHLRSSNLSCLVDALANMTYTPGPDFYGEDTITVRIGITTTGLSSLPLFEVDESVLALFGVAQASGSVSVANVDDVPELFNPGYLFLRELEVTHLWDMDVAHGDGDAMDIVLEVVVSLGEVSLDSFVRGLVVINGGAPVSWPVTSFSMKGPRKNVSTALGGLYYHGSSCQFSEGACESRFSLLNLTATDANGAKAEHSIVVDVTCIAEVPYLVVPPVFGDEDTDIPVPMDCWPMDPLEQVTVFISDIPAGVSFSAGKRQGSRWRLELYELPGLTLRAPPNSHADFNLTVTAVAVEISNGDTAANETVVLVTVDPVNDKPDVVAPGTQYGLEETVSKIGAAVISDVADLPDGQGGAYEVTVTATSGRLLYGVVYGNESLPSTCASLNLTFCAGWMTNTVVLQGAMQDVNSALKTMFYLGDLDFDATDTIVWEVNDLGSVGSGGAQVASDSAPIKVLPVNDAPVILLDSTYDAGCDPDLDNLTCLPTINLFRPREDCYEDTLLGHSMAFTDVDDKGDNYTVRMELLIRLLVAEPAVPRRSAL
jgi:hypothetical protein